MMTTAYFVKLYFYVQVFLLMPINEAIILLLYYIMKKKNLYSYNKKDNFSDNELLFIKSVHVLQHVKWDPHWVKHWLLS